MGIDIIRTNNRNHSDCSEYRSLLSLLNRTSVEMILDVGANIGQFAKGMLSSGYQGEIISFEPLRSEHQRLCAAANGVTNWKIAPRTAIGAAAGELNINISANSISSSLLAMLESHTLASETISSYIGQEKVAVQRLSVAAAPFLTKSPRLFIKIDTQGYEHLVLDGASELLPSTIGLKIELSFENLYEGQKQAAEMLSKIDALGFFLYDLTLGFRDRRTGRLLQADGVFIRNSEREKLNGHLGKM
jgi:FkbM family methyltransferase